MSGRRLSAVLLLLGGAALTPLRSQETSAWRIRIDDGRQVQVLAPGAETTLEVQVLDGAGQPVEGAQVTFLAPETGPSGVFKSTGAEDAQVWSAVSESNGAARARFAANRTIGAYEISVVAGMGQASAEFAVTNFPSAFNPPAGREQIRRRVLNGLELEEARVAVHGPFLLDAGWQVLPALPQADESAYTPETKPVWFLWVDHHPEAAFEHPATLVWIDAADPAAARETWRVQKLEWFPVLIVPDQERILLRAPVITSRRRGPLQNVPDPNPESGPQAALRRRLNDATFVRKEPDACAVVVYGSEEWAFQIDQARAEEFFEKVKLIARSRILTDTKADGSSQASTKAKVGELLEEAKKLNCTRLYFYIASHGGSGYITTLSVDANRPYGYFYYSELAAMLRPFTDAGVEVTAIIQGCETATAIPVLHEWGIKGAVYAAAAPGQFAVGNPYWAGSFYSRALFQAWCDPSADADRDGQVSAEEAHRYGVASYFRADYGAAQYSSLDGQAGSIEIADVIIDPIESRAGLTVQRPATAVGVFTFDATLQHTGIAAFSGPERGSIPANTGGGTLFLTGVGAGYTYAEVHGKDAQGKNYSGRALVRVGTFQVVPRPLVLKVGQFGIANVYQSPRNVNPPRTVQLQVTPLDADTPRIARADATVQFRPGESTSLFGVTGLRPGTASYRLTEQGGTASATAIVIVQGFYTIPENLRVRSGQELTFHIAREGQSTLLPGTPITVRLESTNDPQGRIAVIEPNVISYPAFESFYEVKARGLSPGTATFSITGADGTRWATFDVVVEDGPPVLLSSFDNNTDGWTCSNAQVAHRPGGGNPGGYIFVDNPETTISFLIAPSKFHGDLSHFNGGTLSFDGNMLQALDPPWNAPGQDYGHVTISGDGSSVTKDLVPGLPSQGSWTTYSIPMTAGAWGLTEDQWRAMLRRVTSITVSIEAIFGREQQGFDNFMLRTATAPR